MSEGYGGLAPAAVSEDETENTGILEPQMKCRRWNVEMQPGKVLLRTSTAGVKDFESDKSATTFSFGGPGVLSECLKCPFCGRSVSK